MPDPVHDYYASLRNDPTYGGRQHAPGAAAPIPPAVTPLTPWTHTASRWTLLLLHLLLAATLGLCCYLPAYLTRLVGIYISRGWHAPDSQIAELHVWTRDGGRR